MVQCCPSYHTQSVEQKPWALLFLKSQQRAQQLRCRHLADSSNHLFSAWTSKRWYLFVHMNKQICHMLNMHSKWVDEFVNLTQHPWISITHHEHPWHPYHLWKVICLHPKQGGWHSLCRALVSQIGSFHMFPCLNMLEIRTLGTGWPETWKISGYFCNQLLEEIAPTGRVLSFVCTYSWNMNLFLRIAWIWKLKQTKYLRYI